MTGYPPTALAVLRNITIASPALACNPYAGGGGSDVPPKGMRSAEPDCLPTLRTGRHESLGPLPAGPAPTPRPAPTRTHPLVTHRRLRYAVFVTPVEPTTSEALDIDERGVDRAQIRAQLRKTPEQRLAALQAMVDFIVEARRGRRSPAVR